MLTNSTKKRIQEILNRISNNQVISIEERLYLQRLADKDQTVASWLHQARRKQQNPHNNSGIDGLLGDLSLGAIDPDDSYLPRKDDLGDWFRGAPSWLGRS